MTTTTTPPIFTDEVIADIEETSRNMYEHFYDLLATYQFNFSPDGKEWILQKITQDIRLANQEGDRG